jgi:putative ABC transport system permease protein
MKLRDLIGFGGGGLRGHRLRTGLTVLGVTIGVAAVVLLTSLGEGARLYVTGEFASLGSNLLIMVPGKTETTGGAPMVSTGSRDLTLEDALALEAQVSDLSRVAPVSVGTARAESQDRGRDITVIGTTRSLLEVRQLRLRSGRYLPADTPDAPICVLGAKVASELFGGQNPLGERIRVGGVKMRVIGLMAPRGTSIGMDLDEVVHVPVKTAMRMFDQSSLFRILAEVRTPERIDATAELCRRIIEDRHDDDDVTIITQDAVLSTFDSILGALTLALGAIAAISLTVAGIGIMNVMLVAVSERTSEIGLLKALGVTERQVLAVFLVESSVISLIGGALGLLLALAGTVFVRAQLPDFPAQPPPWAVAAAIFTSLGVGILFGMIPARRAMHLDPIDALMGHRG